MNPSQANRFDDWRTELTDFLGRSPAVAVGILSTDGQLLLANAGLLALLGGDQTRAPNLDYLINPPLAELIRVVPYRGFLTFGSPIGPYVSLAGQAQRRGEQILLIASYDVEELTRTTAQVIEMNSAITNLQRDLSLANSGLERALTELQGTQIQLVHSEKMNAMGQLTAGVAHEINNPMAFVNSNLHSLQTAVSRLASAYQTLESLIESEGTDSQRETAHVLRRKADLDFIIEDLDDLLKASLDGVGRVKRIVEDLRTFSRLDENEFKEADLRENLRSTLALARPALRDRITVNIDLNGVPPLRCYPAELNQVFMNILLNAAQAIEGSGTMTIRGRDEPHQVVLSFTDTGCGMTPEVLKQIFNPFFTTKPVGSGTGLGLSVAYKIITDRHQGTISAQSTPGQGSTFTICLPKDIRP